MGVRLRIETLRSQHGAAEHTNGYSAGSSVLLGSKFYMHRRIDASKNGNTHHMKHVSFTYHMALGWLIVFLTNFFLESLLDSIFFFTSLAHHETNQTLFLIKCAT